MRPTHFLSLPPLISLTSRDVPPSHNKVSGDTIIPSSIQKKKRTKRVFELQVNSPWSLILCVLQRWKGRGDVCNEEDPGSLRVRCRVWRGGVERWKFDSCAFLLFTCMRAAVLYQKSWQNNFHQKPIQENHSRCLLQIPLRRITLPVFPNWQNTHRWFYIFQSRLFKNENRILNNSCQMHHGFFASLFCG